MEIKIDDVAKLANVSKATVSAVMNNKPGVSAQTRENVLKIVKKFNYRPNQVARSLSIRATKSIGLVIKEIDNPYYAKIMRGVFDTCTKKDYTVLLGSSELTFSQELQSIETLVNQRVDGLIISPLQGEGSDFSCLAELIRMKYPLVMLNEVINFPTNVVNIRNVDAAYKAVSYLITKGHRKIAYFTGPENSSHSIDRMEGFNKALIEHNLLLNNKYLLAAGSYIENGYQKGKEFFQTINDSPTAVFCYNDLVAIGLINALLEMNIKVPEDVAVIGFDNIDFCKSAKIPLTTVLNPAYKIGEAATELLIKQINCKEHTLSESIILDTYLVKRNSA